MRVPRGREFVTRKITDAVAKIKLGMQSYIELGNLDSKRDWGYAKDYVKGMWKMLQVDEADTFVLATKRTETVRDFVDMAFKAADINIKFEGSGEDERGIDVDSGKTIMRINKKFYRPAQVEFARWRPISCKKS